MNRSDVRELHYIAPIANVPSIVEYGILSNSSAARVHHQSVAMAEVQDRRRPKLIPGGRFLHEYVNLYFDAHNPMLSKCRSQNDAICVLRVSDTVLDAPNAIVTDRNAASGYARFYPVRNGIAVLDKTMVYAQYWTHPDVYEAMTRKSAKCAEALVPERVEADLIVGAYVANVRALGAFEALSLRLPVAIKRDMFF